MTCSTDPDAVRMAPCLLQERVAKDHELRVTVVGQETVAVRIDSHTTPTLGWTGDGRSTTWATGSYLSSPIWNERYAR